MMDRIKSDLVPLLLRVCLGIIVLSHGYIKIQLAGGEDWNPDLHPTAAVAVAWGEMIGGLALIIGLLTRVAALGIAVIQVGAIIMVTSQRGLISVTDTVAPRLQPGMVFGSVGFEYNFALLTMCVCLILVGGGRLAADYVGWKSTTSAGTTSSQTAPPVTV